MMHGGIVMCIDMTIPPCIIKFLYTNWHLPQYFAITLYGSYHVFDYEFMMHAACTESLWHFHSKLVFKI